MGMNTNSPINILILFKTYSEEQQTMLSEGLAPARVFFPSTNSEALDLARSHSISHAVVPFNSPVESVEALGRLVTSWHNASIDANTNPISFHVEGHQHVSGDDHVRHEILDTMKFIRKVLNDSE
jgi:hypothetical protein